MFNISIIDTLKYSSNISLALSKQSSIFPGKSLLLQEGDFSSSSSTPKFKSLKLQVIFGINVSTFPFVPPFMKIFSNSSHCFTK